MSRSLIGLLNCTRPVVWLRNCFQARKSGKSYGGIAGIRLIDLRSDRDKELEAEVNRGIGIPPESAEVHRVLLEMDIWGKANRYPSHEQYPQYHLIRGLGQKIYDRDGMEGMR